MELQVFGQSELINHIKKGRPVFSHLISITNPGEASREEDESHEIPELFRRRFQAVLELKFWDTEETRCLVHHEPKIIPEKSDVEKVLAFVETTKHEATGYTIHCWRGISRSTAVAFGILFYFLRDEQKAARRLVEIRRIAMPLKRIVRFYDEIFGSNLARFGNTIYRARLELMKENLYNSKPVELNPVEEEEEDV